MLRNHLSYFCCKRAVKNRFLKLEHFLLSRVAHFRNITQSSAIITAAEAPALSLLMQRFPTTTTANSKNNLFGLNRLSFEVTARQIRSLSCGGQLTAKQADHCSYYNSYFPLLSQTRLYSRRQRFVDSGDDISEAPWSASSKVAIYNDKEYVVSLAGSETSDYVKKNHPDKKLQMTKRVNQHGERVAQLVQSVKETSFMISTNIEPADLQTQPLLTPGLFRQAVYCEGNRCFLRNTQLVETGYLEALGHKLEIQVKIIAIQRKIAKGNIVVIKFKHRMNKSEKTVNGFATELKAKLEQEGLPVILSNPSENNVTLTVKSAPLDS